MHQLLKTTLLFLLLLNTSFSSFASNNKILAVPVASFTSATITGINTTITLTDASTNTPTSWAWVFSPATVTYQNSTTAASQNPQVNFTASGTYSITLTATNADGSHAVTNKVYVVGTATAPYTGTFAGSVVTPFVFPPTDWAVVNPDAPAKGWEATIVTSIANEPREVARMDNFQYNAAGQLDDLVMPMMDLSALTNPQLTFNVAYAPYSSTNFERLYIQCSTDGGVTFTTTAYDKSHLDLGTVTYQTSGWAPTTPADWRVETVNLLAFKSSNTIIKFVQQTGYGNGLFIHDVKIIEGPALPVELTAFEGTQVEMANLLTWQTASEQSNKGFFIEKSQDGENWKTIDFVVGNGSTTQISNYQYNDENLTGFKNLQGLNFYYRLKQIDFDGQYEYSNIIHITREQSVGQAIDIYPNPATGDFINIHVESENATISLQDNTGKTIRSFQSTSNISQLDISNLPSGLYYISIITNGAQTVKKIIVE